MSSHPKRVVSGMRPTGKLHLGHYYGVLKNWVKLQHEYECFFFAADWHALTTHYDESQTISDNVWEMLIDWLAAGVNPGSACIFMQSAVPEIAELQLLLAMITPLGWLERVPTFKEQQQKLSNRDLSTYGFFGYPLLQTADILTFRGTYVPVGEDQVSHIEFSREVARRFNHFYGKEPGFAEKVKLAIQKLGKKGSKFYLDMRRQYQEQGSDEALTKGQAYLASQNNISIGDRERLLGDLEGGGKIILPEPQSLLTEFSKLPGTDGQKMSKSYNNTIPMREEPEVVEKAIKTMPTDPARVRRTDPGEPESCPVWGLHEVFSTDEVKSWASSGCRTAGIGCLECKRPLIDEILKEQATIMERAREFEEDPGLVKGIVAEGCERARDEAKETLHDVREAIGLNY